MVGRIAIIDRTGHTEMCFDTAAPETVAEVEAVLKQARTEGRIPYVNGADGKAVQILGISDLDLGKPEETVYLRPVMVAG